VPFLPALPFVPLLPVPLLSVPLLSVPFYRAIFTCANSIWAIFIGAIFPRHRVFLSDKCKIKTASENSTCRL